MVRIEQLHKAFGRLEVLKGVDLRFDRPGISAILGPNGSGKTTLIKCILGMVLPNDGRIELDGKSISGKWDYRRRLGYLPQIARFPDNLRVRELLRFIRSLRSDEARPQPLIDRFGLEPFLDKRLGHLSGGTRQKVNLTLAFMYDTPLYILDEPTAGLDPVALQQLKALLKEEKARDKTLLVTTHIMDFVEEMADDIVFLLEGVTYFRGAPEQLKERFGAEKLEPAIAAILQQKDQDLAVEEMETKSSPKRLRVNRLTPVQA